MGIKKVCASLVLATLSFNASAVVLNVDSSTHKLMSASGVDVGGTLYDVTFADGIVGNSTILFTTFNSAKLASEALRDQVFIDSALGQFDSNTTLTNGCSATFLCNVSTAYAISGLSVSIASFFNGPAGMSDAVSTLPAQSSLTTNTANMPFVTIATWSVAATAPTTAVPEPETYAMFLAGLGLLGFMARRRKA